MLMTIAFDWNWMELVNQTMKLNVLLATLYKDCEIQRDPPRHNSSSHIYLSFGWLTYPSEKKFQTTNHIYIIIMIYYLDSLFIIVTPELGMLYTSA